VNLLHAYILKFVHQLNQVVSKWPSVVNVHEAKTHFSRLLEQAHAEQEILLAKADKPYARLMPLERGTIRRQAGRLQGRVTEAFFDPLPEEDLDAWESR
jgi:antitoxin (DNA-binding transcriptional repressor) of toxin-antitoxin stability system